MLWAHASNTARLEQSFRYQKFDWDYNIFTSSSLSDDGGSIVLTQTDQEESGNTLNADTRLTGEVTTGAATHRLLVGIDALRYSFDNTTVFSTPLSTIDWRDPGLGGFRPGPAWYTKNEDLTITQVGIYAQDEISWDNWRMSLGLRHSWVKQTGTVTVNGIESDGYQKDNATSGRIGLSYVFDNGVAPYVSYSTSFDPEIGTDRAGNAFEPTEGKQWEVGVKYQPSDAILLTAAYYDLKQDNLIRYDAAGLPVQSGEVRARGLELEATAELAQGWDIRAAYAYTDTRLSGDVAPETDPTAIFYDGNRAANSPYHMASLWLVRDFDNGFRLGGGVRYVGERYGDDANNYPLDSNTLVDLGASYTRDNIVASLNVLNLTDKTYLASCSQFYCNYGEGREIQARLSYQW